MYHSYCSLNKIIKTIILFQGIGIGLSLCTLLCKVMGANLKVESRELTPDDRAAYFKVGHATLSLRMWLNTL